jgi:hypothetical protein
MVEDGSLCDFFMLEENVNLRGRRPVLGGESQHAPVVAVEIDFFELLPPSEKYRVLGIDIQFRTCSFQFSIPPHRLRSQYDSQE